MVCLGLRQCSPVEIQLAILQMTGDEHARLGVVAMSQRNARGGRATGGGRNAWRHLEWDPRRGQLLDFLTAASEDEGVAAP